MKSFCLIFAIFSFLLFVPAVAQSYKVDPNTPGVFLYAEQFPFMVGGDEAAERYIRNNVKYPLDVWKATHRKEFSVTFLVTSNGEIKNVHIANTMKNYPEQLAKEVIRVVSGMPKWKPGFVKGRAVNSWRNIGGYLVDGMDIYDVGSLCYPPSVKRWLAPKLKEAKDKRHYAGGMSQEEAERKCKVLAEAYEVAPDHPVIASAYTRVLMALGRKEEAVVTIDSCIARYVAKNDWDEYDPNYIFSSEPRRMGYVGKTELWLRLVAAAARSVAGQPVDSVRDALEDVKEHSDMKIYNHDIVTYNRLGRDARIHDDGDDEKVRVLMQEKADIVHGNPERLSAAEIAEIEHENILRARMAVIDKYIMQGKISNARVLQISGEISNIENKPPHIPGVVPNTARLYALNALVAYLMDGVEAQQKCFKAAEIEESRSVRQEVKNWQKKVVAAGLADGDRVCALRCLACCAPMQGEGDEAVRRFYDVQRKLYAAYPIEWLKE